MAEYNVDIQVKASTGQAERDITRLVGKIKQIENIELVPKTTSTVIKKAAEDVNGLSKSYNRLKATLGAGGVAGAISLLSRGVGDLGSKLAEIPVGLGLGSLRDFGEQAVQATSGVNHLTTSIASLAGNAPLTTAALGALGVAAYVFSDQIGAATAKTGQFFRELQNLVAAGVIRELNEDIQLTNKGFIELAKGEGLTGLKQLLRDAQQESNKLMSSDEAYRDSVILTLDVQKAINEEMSRRRLIYSNLTSDERALRTQIEQNLRASKAGRQASGFAEFSQAAGAQTAIDKSVRRQQDRLAKRLRGFEFELPQLALPAFEERGFKVLVDSYDTALGKAQQLSSATTTAANVSAALADNNTRGARFIQKSAEYAELLGAYYKKDALPAAKETNKQVSATEKLYKNTLDITYPQIEAQRQLLDLENKQTAAAKRTNAAQKERGKLLENLALGAGFPLLFGGGIGAIGGGLAGSFVGQGFGGQIIGSAVGQIFDRAIQAVGALGQALVPATADIGALTKATGLVGSETEALIKSFDSADSSATALDAATRQMALIVGNQGVKALIEFGSETQQLANQWNILMTQMGAGLSTLLTGPVGELVKMVERTAAVGVARTSEDPVLKNLYRQLSAAPSPIVLGPGSTVDFGEGKRLELEDAILKRVQQLRDEEEARLKGLERINATRRTELDILDIQIALAGTSGKLEDNNVYTLQQKLIYRKFDIEYQNAVNKGLSKELVLRQLTLDLAVLKQQREEAIAQAQERAAREAERQQKEQERLVEKMNAQYLASRQSHELAKRDLAIAQSDIGFSRIKAEYDKERAVRMDDYRKKYSEALSEQEQEELVATQLLQSETARLEYLKAQNAEFYRQVELATSIDDRTRSIVSNLGSLFTLDLDLSGLLSTDTVASELEKVRGELEKLISPANQAARAAENIGNAFSTSFTDTINGSMSAQEALANFFKNTANAFLDMAAQMIAKYIQMQILGLAASFFPGGGLFKGAGPYQFGGGNTGISGFGFGTNILTGKANGGPVSAGTPYLVGERGPELFMPRTSGSIYPNDAMGVGGSNIVVNVDAAGTNVQGDQPNANRLGEALGAAVRAELVRQKRPGGLLA